MNPGTQHITMKFLQVMKRWPLSIEIQSRDIREDRMGKLEVKPRLLVLRKLVQRFQWKWDI